jgi:hypothetical protein
LNWRDAEVLMTRCLSTLLAFAAAMLVAGSSQAQQAPAQPAAAGLRAGLPAFASRATAPSADRISLLTVENHLPEVAGMYVRMEPAVVEAVKSPRLFTLGGLLFPAHYMDDDDRALVLLAAPAPQIGRGTLVEVTGWVTTLATARQAFGTDWGLAPDDDAFEDANRVVIVANVVRAVDGAELASRP